MFKLILVSLGAYIIATAAADCPPNRSYYYCVPLKNFGDIPAGGRCEPQEYVAFHPQSTLAEFNETISSSNYPFIVLTYWTSINSVCPMKNMMLFNELVYNYQRNINFLGFQCPSPVCTHLNATSNMDWHYYGSDGQLKAQLTHGLSTSQYVEKANELVDPKLHKSYEGIRKKVEDDCRALSPDVRSSRFNVLYPEDFTDSHDGECSATYKAKCPQLFDN